MELAWGVVMVVTGLVGWGGQLLSATLPSLAVRLGVMEAEDQVDAAFCADVRSEARWDALTTWTLPLAGLLLLLDEPNWAYLGLVGGATYLYFGGRGIGQRLTIQAAGMRVGAPSTVRAAIAALAIWAVVGAVTIALAVDRLQPI